MRCGSAVPDAMRHVRCRSRRGRRSHGAVPVALWERRLRRDAASATAPGGWSGVSSGVPATADWVSPAPPAAADPRLFVAAASAVAGLAASASSSAPRASARSTASNSARASSRMQSPCAPLSVTIREKLKKHGYYCPLRGQSRYENQPVFFPETHAAREYKTKHAALPGCLESRMARKSVRVGCSGCGGLERRLVLDRIRGRRPIVLACTNTAPAGSRSAHSIPT